MESLTSHSPEPTLSPADARSHARAPTRSSAKSFASGQGIVGPSLSSMLGNETIGRMLASGHSQSGFAPSTLGILGIQAKLHVSAADDPQEQEADRVADEVMRMPEPATTVQRVCSGCDVEQPQRESDEDDAQRDADEDDLHRDADDEDDAQRSAFDGFVQRRAASSNHRAGFTADASIAARIQAVRGGGSALDGPSRAFLEPRFGVDFSPVRIHAGTEAAQLSRSLRAHAFTIGSDIFFGEGKYQPQSDTGRRLLSHELTHVVQQKGPGLQRSSPDTLFRFSIEGCFNKGDPVHEVLTLLTLGEADKMLKKVGISKRSLLKNLDVKKLPGWNSVKWHNYDPKDTPRVAQEFIRGVVWPDDPKGLLFDDPKGTENYSSCMEWVEEFDKDEKNDPRALIARSHYGDLQFFHGMASGKEEPAALTQSKMLSWARFLVQVALGILTAKTMLKSIPAVAVLFSGFPTYTVADLFAGNPKDGKKLTDVDVKQRAVGALLHLIQDSCAKGHVERTSDGAIVQSHDYGGQDSKKHGHDDEWANGKTLKERVENTSGAMMAVKYGSLAVALLETGDEVSTMWFLEQFVFRLSPSAKPSGPGAEFEKKK